MGPAAPVTSRAVGPHCRPGLHHRLGRSGGGGPTTAEVAQDAIRARWPAGDGPAEPAIATAMRMRGRCVSTTRRSSRTCSGWSSHRAELAAARSSQLAARPTTRSVRCGTRARSRRLRLDLEPHHGDMGAPLGVGRMGADVGVTPADERAARMRSFSRLDSAAAPRHHHRRRVQMIIVINTIQLPKPINSHQHDPVAKADHTGRGPKDLPEHCSEISGRSWPRPQALCPLARREHSRRNLSLGLPS